MKNKTPPKSKTEIKSDLIQRVIIVKTLLPKHGVTSLFVEMFPKYKPTRERAKVSAVLSFRSTDVKIIEQLESIAKKLISSKQ